MAERIRTVEEGDIFFFSNPTIHWAVAQCDHPGYQPLPHGMAGTLPGLHAGHRARYPQRRAHIRRRLRAIVLKHWKRERTIVRRLVRLGVHLLTARRRVNGGRKSIWALSADRRAVHWGLRNVYFTERGFVPLEERFARVWSEIRAPEQLRLNLDAARS